MARIEPLNVEAAEGKARELLDIVRKKMGKAPNLVRTMAHSPATLAAYLQFSEALGMSALSAKVREQIALAVSEANGCGYCVAAHSAIGRRQGLSDEELRQSRLGESADPRTAAILGFTRALVERRGHVGDAEIESLRAEGVSDGEITEIVAVVALNTLTNYLNHVAETELDFPAAEALSPTLVGAN